MKLVKLVLALAVVQVAIWGSVAVVISGCQQAEQPQQPTSPPATGGGGGDGGGGDDPGDGEDGELPCNDDGTGGGCDPDFNPEGDAEIGCGEQTEEGEPGASCRTLADGVVSDTCIANEQDCRIECDGQPCLIEFNGCSVQGDINACQVDGQVVYRGRECSGMVQAPEGTTTARCCSKDADTPDDEVCGEAVVHVRTGGGPQPEPEPTDFLDVTPDRRTVEHVVGESPCPQTFDDVFGVANTGTRDMSVMVSVDNPAVVIIPNAFVVPAGETASVDGSFDCSTTDSFGTDVTFTARAGRASQMETSRFRVEITSPTPDVCPAPSDLTATAPFFDLVQLQWTDNSTNENRFDIERCTGVGCTDFSLHGTAGANSTVFFDFTVEGGTRYRYRAFAVCPTGRSDASNIVGVTTPDGPP